MSLLPSSMTAWPWRRGVRIALRWGGGLLLAAWSIVLLAGLVLHWGILPRLDTWRPHIERTASEVLGLPVRIGRIRVESRGWVPALELRDVRLLDAAGREALHLPQVRAAVSTRSLLHLEPRFAQLLIEAPALEVRRDARGRLFVAGLDFSGPGGTGPNPALDWFFRQPEFALRGGTLRWVDEQRRAPPLTLRQVDLVVRNGGLAQRRHELRLDATPEPGWGERFSLRGRFTHPLLGHPGDWQRWSGQAYAELPWADLSRLRHHVTLPFELREGEGALRLWSDWHEGRPDSVTADLALRSVALRLRPELAPLELHALQGRISAEQRGRERSVHAQGLAFRTGDGRSWPAGTLALKWTAPDARSPGGGELRAERLDLAILAQLAGRLPLGEPLRRLLAELQPQGTVQPLEARWSGPLDQPLSYRAQVRAEGVTLAAQRSGIVPGEPGRPGVRGAAFELSATERGGEGVLRLADGALELPGVFDEALVPMQRLNARLDWQRTPRRGAPAGAPRELTVQLREVRFANADAEGTLQARWHPGADPARRHPGVLELQGRLQRAEATRVWRYLPQALPQDVRDYVRDAVRAGRARQVDFRVQGDLRDFPFARGGGEFRIAAPIEAARLAYVPDAPGAPSPWPALDELNGTLVFDRNAMEIRDARARVFGVALAGVRGRIADLDAPVLQLEGGGRGPLADALRFIAASPIAEWTGHGLDRAAGSGPLELQLKLELPLDRIEHSRVSGRATLAGNELRLTPEAPQMSAARGVVEFSEQGFALRQASARIYGGEARFSGGSQDDGRLRFEGQGTASAEGLRQASELPWLPHLAKHLSGQAAYQARIGIVHGEIELDIASTLAGMASDLPAPLTKPAAATLPLRVRSTLELAPPAGRPPRDRLQLDLGTLAHAHWTRELRPEGARVLSGGIGVQAAAPQPAAGVAAAVQLASLDADAWQAVLDALPDDLGTPAGSAASGSPAARAAADADNTLAGGYGPTRVALRARELRFGGRQLDQVVAGLSFDAGRWRANLDAQQLSGYAEYRPPRPDAAGDGHAGRLYARLSRLTLPPGQQENVTALLDGQPAASVPALDIVVEDFTMQGRRLGRLEVEAINRTTGEIREWRLNRFALTAPEAQLSASGSWLGVRGSGGGLQRRATMDFRLELADSGALLARLGQPGVLHGGKGRIDGALSWLGSPLAPDVPSLSGQLQVELGRGRFLKAEPGLAKLLGVLSLQALPRRLALDFRDVFQEGFAFDAIHGDVRIDAGRAATNNLSMRGVQAAVLMEGGADLARETQDLRVVVVPEINAGTASLAYAAINPAVGLGTFLAQMFLRKPLMQASTREFRITGDWADPQVEAVKRDARAPLPELPDPGRATGAASRGG